LAAINSSAQGPLSAPVSLTYPAARRAHRPGTKKNRP
jgi:hypothetical protein